MMSCADAARIMSDQMNGEANKGVRVRLRLHLLICSSCQQYWKQLALLRRWLKSGLLGQDLPVGREPVQLEASTRKRIEDNLRVELHRTKPD